MDTVVPSGLFLVTAVGPESRSAVVQVTEELQVEAPLAMVQEVAERVPEGLMVNVADTVQEPVIEPVV